MATEPSFNGMPQATLFSECRQSRNISDAAEVCVLHSVMNRSLQNRDQSIYFHRSSACFQLMRLTEKMLEESADCGIGHARLALQSVCFLSEKLLVLEGGDSINLFNCLNLNFFMLLCK